MKETKTRGGGREGSGGLRIPGRAVDKGGSRERRKGWPIWETMGKKVGQNSGRAKGWRKRSTRVPHSPLPSSPPPPGGDKKGRFRSGTRTSASSRMRTSARTRTRTSTRRRRNGKKGAVEAKRRQDTVQPPN
eukprot:221152-Hanusia_phi.AAC.1